MPAWLRPILSLSVFVIALLVSLPVQFDRDESENEEGHAFEAFEFWYNQRALPYDKIPAGAYVKAFEYSRSKLMKERGLSGIWADTTSWSSIGPDNVGGRVLAVAVDPASPNVVWAGAASGGLWKSTTAGAGTAAWNYVNTGYPTVAVSSIAIDSLNPSLMYIGTGEVGSGYGRGQVGTSGARSSYGMGVLKSIDGGATWSLTGLTSTFPLVTAVQKVLINPKNVNTVFAATTEGTFKTTDGGTTWSNVHSILMAMDIVINPVDTTILYAAYGQRNTTGGTQGLYKTTNAGSTWTLLAGGLPVASEFGRTSLAIARSNPSIVYAGIANAGTSQLRGVYRTTNSGTTWTLQTTTNYVNSQGWYDNVLAVDPTNPERIYCAGLDIYRSVDGGITMDQRSFWFAGYEGVVPAGGPEGPSDYAHADHHAIAFNPLNPSIVYFGTDGGIFVSTNGGEGFDGRNGGFATTQFYNGFANSESDSSIALGGLQDNGTLKYIGGGSWDKTYGGDGGWCAIDPTNPLVMYEEYVYLAMSKTVNGGATWSGATNGLATGSSNANFIAPFVIAPSNPNILYAGARTIYKTTDAGTNWFATNGGSNFNGTMVASIGVATTSPDTLIIGTGSSATGAVFQIFRSTNGGTSWSNVTGTNPNRYPTDIAFDQGSGTIAYLAYSGYGTPHVFRTSDAGLTWTNISSDLPDIPVQSILSDPQFPNTLFAGTDLGVYRSTNGGGNWHSFETGMPPAMITDLNISSVNRVLRASTFGNGVYERGLITPNIFDYRALAFISPTSGRNVLVNSLISPIRASYRNLGALSPIDSFDVRFEIRNGPTTVYSSTKRIAELAANQVVDITFDGSFTPSATGVFTLLAIVLAGDNNVTNDTLSGILNVTTAGPVASIPVTKEHCPYVPLASQGTPVATAGGDDAQYSLALPFPVEFDSFMYDQIQISTNGWVELGTGTAGTERGLSTSTQIGSLGANQNGSLFSSAHPLKALGAWWEDMDVDGSALLSYATIGSAPSRRFVVEWNNVLSYYDAVSTSTRINFQVEFTEGSPVIRYHYGPVSAGTFGGSDIGAMTGIKDHVGGDYHYLDFSSRQTGTVSEGNTNLNPLTDWPGEDSCYVFGMETTTTSVAINDRWNIVSLPLIASDRSVQSVFPTGISGTTYRFLGGTYGQVDTLTAGWGYWTKFPAPVSQSITGAPLPTMTVALDSGWNLIGSVDHAITPPSDPLIISPFYEYSDGYGIAGSIRPGKGYWVKTSGPLLITLGPGAEGSAEPTILSDAATITISDRNGSRQSLFLAPTRYPDDGGSGIEMPPPAPSGAFDVRYASNAILERYPADCSDGKTYPLTIRGVSYPLQITPGLPASFDKKLSVVCISSGKITGSNLLPPGGSVTIGAPPQGVLALMVTNGGNRPSRFALGQNYPNPFNPVTRIRFDLPTDEDVTLAIYDLTGKEVMRATGGHYAAGSYTITLDMKDRSSGVYYYRLTAGSYREVKKFVLLK